MDSDQLAATVDHSMRIDAGDLTCDEPGHTGGHACLPVSGGVDMDGLVKTLTKRYGSASGGTAAHLRQVRCGGQEWLQFGDIAYQHHSNAVVVVDPPRRLPTVDLRATLVHPGHYPWSPRFVPTPGPGNASFDSRFNTSRRFPVSARRRWVAQCPTAGIRSPARKVNGL
ncbi:hypothetical protein AB0H00_14290 [Nocardia sp. NPDC023852]|uniref:hypothetical protein n=1 Tax=Nocardia sp. NPDC023852 TaxID=3154697 RepID=UPI00340E9DF7